MAVVATMFLLILAMFPVVVILLYMYYKDKNKEPLSLLISLFLTGFVSCILVLIVSGILRLFCPFMLGRVEDKGFIDTILYAFLGVALVEETCKWLMAYVVGYNHREFDELYDGIVYCIFVSLGFAFIENIVYVIKLYSITTGLLRAVTAVPSHAFYAIFMGYYLSIAKQYALKGDFNNEKKNLLLSVLIPALIHGIYDYCIMSGHKILAIVFIAFVIYLYIISFSKLKKMDSINRKIKFKNNFCPNCGKAITGEFCSKCGKKQE